MFDDGGALIPIVAYVGVSVVGGIIFGFSLVITSIIHKFIRIRMKREIRARKIVDFLAVSLSIVAVSAVFFVVVFFGFNLIYETDVQRCGLIANIGSECGSYLGSVGSQAGGRLFGAALFVLDQFFSVALLDFLDIMHQDFTNVTYNWVGFFFIFIYRILVSFLWVDTLIKMISKDE